MPNLSFLHMYCGPVHQHYILDWELRLAICNFVTGISGIHTRGGKLYPATHFTVKFPADFSFNMTILDLIYFYLGHRRSHCSRFITATVIESDNMKGVLDGLLHISKALLEETLVIMTGDSFKLGEWKIENPILYMIRIIQKYYHRLTNHHLEPHLCWSKVADSYLYNITSAWIKGFSIYYGLFFHPKSLMICVVKSFFLNLLTESNLECQEIIWDYQLAMAYNLAMNSMLLNGGFRWKKWVLKTDEFRISEDRDRVYFVWLTEQGQLRPFAVLKTYSGDDKLMAYDLSTQNWKSSFFGRLEYDMMGPGFTIIPCQIFNFRPYRNEEFVSEFLTTIGLKNQTHVEEIFRDIKTFGQ